MEADDRAGVDPAAEKCAHRDVADEMVPDRFVELGTQFFNGVLLGPLFIRLKPQLPVPFDDRLVLRVQT